MDERRTVLVAEPDQELAASLYEVLAQDYELLVVYDGTQALEQTVLGYPDLVLYDAACPLVGGSQFLKVLRALPGGQELPVILMGSGDFIKHKPDSFLRTSICKPFNLDEVCARVARVFRQVDVASGVFGEAHALVGSLTQVSLVDLLQILSMNRRTGRLSIEADDRRYPGEVFIDCGEVVEAAFGPTMGRKALFRLLGWERGRFSFTANRTAPSRSIAGATDRLVMEGYQHLDEIANMAEQIPPPDAVVDRLVSFKELPSGLQPVAEEVMALVELHRRVEDVVDRAQAIDLEVYHALHSLAAARLIRIEVGRSHSKHALLSREQLAEFALRLRQASLPSAYRNCPKLLVLAESSESWDSLMEGLRGIREFAPGDCERLRAAGFGRFGALELGECLRVDFVGFVVRAPMLPMLSAISSGVVGGLSLTTTTAEEATESAGVVQLQRDLRIELKPVRSYLFEDLARVLRAVLLGNG